MAALQAEREALLGELAANMEMQERDLQESERLRGVVSAREAQIDEAERRRAAEASERFAAELKLALDDLELRKDRDARAALDKAASEAEATRKAERDAEKAEGQRLLEACKKLSLIHI